MTRLPVTRLLAILAALLAWPTGAAAQRPDFSGTWVVMVDSTAGRTTVAATGDAAFRRGDAGSGWGSPLTIAQQPARLDVQYQVFSAYDLQPPLQFTFALDGSPSTHTVMIGHAASVLRSTAGWSGDTLVITTHVPGPPGPDGRPTNAQLRQSLHMASPSTLVIVATRSGIPGAAATTSRTTYSRR